MSEKNSYIRSQHRSVFAVLFQQIRYAWNDTRRDIKQQPLATLLTVTVIAISLTLPAAGYLLWKNVKSAALQWYPTPQLTLYFDKTLSESATTQIINHLKQFDGVKQINYLSKDEALKEFRQWSGYNDALTLLDENPLPAIAIVTPASHFLDEDNLLALRDTIRVIEGIEDVRLDDSWFTRLISLTQLVALIAVVMTGLMVVAVFLVIGNSIRSNVFSRRETINIMKLIGATDSFILRPFLNSGALLGFCGAILAAIILQLLVWGLSLAVFSAAQVLNIQFVLAGLSWDEIVLLLLSATMIGWSAAWLATHRYLRTFMPE